MEKNKTDRNLTDNNSKVKTTLESMTRQYSILGETDLLREMTIVSFPLIAIARRAGISAKKVSEGLPIVIAVGEGLFHPKIVQARRIGIKKVIRESVKEPSIQGERQGKRRLQEDVLKRKTQQATLERKRVIFEEPRAKTSSRGNRKEAAINAVLSRQTDSHKDMQTLLQEIPSWIKLQNSIVESASWSNIDRMSTIVGNNLRIGIELCPIYEINTDLSGSRLVSDTNNEHSIINSRVAGKWSATKQALEVLSTLGSKLGLKLTIQATFADIGVFTDNDQASNVTSLDQHASLYETLLKKICHELHIELEFDRLSQRIPLDKQRIVKPFTMGAPNGKPRQTSPESLVRMLGIDSKQLKDEDKQRLLFIFRACGDNNEVFTTLVNTYINYAPSANCDIHVSVERMSSLLALATMLPNSPMKKVSTLNILVQ